MKVKDVIAKLMEADPESDLRVQVRYDSGYGTASSCDEQVFVSVNANGIACISGDEDCPE